MYCNKNILPFQRHMILPQKRFSSPSTYQTNVFLFKKRVNLQRKHFSFSKTYQSATKIWLLFRDISRGTTRLMSWPDEKHYSCPLQCLVSLVSTLVFLDWKHTVSSKFFDTQVSSIFTKELVLSRHAHCVFSRLHCKAHSLPLSSYLSRIGRIENPSCSGCGRPSQDTSRLTCTIQLRTLCTARSLATLCVYDLWSRPWRVARLLGLHGLPPCPHPSEGFG